MASRAIWCLPVNTRAQKGLRSGRRHRRYKLRVMLWVCVCVSAWACKTNEQTCPIEVGTWYIVYCVIGYVWTIIIGEHVRMGQRKNATSPSNARSTAIHERNFHERQDYDFILNFFPHADWRFTYSILVRSVYCSIRISIHVPTTGAVTRFIIFFYCYFYLLRSVSAFAVASENSSIHFLFFITFTLVICVPYAGQGSHRRYMGNVYSVLTKKMPDMTMSIAAFGSDSNSLVNGCCAAIFHAYPSKSQRNDDSRRSCTANGRQPTNLLLATAETLETGRIPTKWALFHFSYSRSRPEAHAQSHSHSSFYLLSRSIYYFTNIWMTTDKSRVYLKQLAATWPRIALTFSLFWFT